MSDLITLEEAKLYLRIDSSDEDATVSALLAASEKLCMDVARLSDEQWEEIISTEDENLMRVREVIKVAALYGLGYLFEHREEADHHGLVMTLRSLLFAVREGVF